MADPKRAGNQYGSQGAGATSPSFEGTAARTRPCSVEDIILKRYSKKLMKDAKEGNSSTKIKSELVKPDIEDIALQLKDSAGETHAMRSVAGSISQKKNLSGDELPSTKDTSSRREEKHNMEDTGILKRSEKDDSRVTPKSKPHKDDDNSKAFGDTLKESGKEERNEKRSHHKSKGYDEHRDSDYHREDKRELMKVEKERIKDKGPDKSRREERGSQRKYEDQRDDKRKTDKDRVKRRESKRKHEDDQDEKMRMEIDKRDKKKNDARFHLADKFDKRQDVDYLERKERWKESSHPSWHKETKSKRSKRSLSPDHKKAKERGRSPSSSPRSHKRHSSYYDKDHDQDHSSHHMSVEKSERDTVDSEKNEKDNNGHYRRYGGGTSGLGGYSPRRRRSETAVKTPSPPVHLPERKPAWDMTPGGMDSNMVAAMVAAYQASTQQMAASSITPALATVSLSTSNLQTPSVSASQFVPSISQQVDSVMDTIELTQSSRPARRIVVNNLPPSVAEGELMEFLNSVLLSKSANQLPGTKPCINCVVNGDKNQAYAEFLTPEDATATLLLDGITLKGNNLKIKRPKDYAEPANGGSGKILPAVDLISSTVVDSPYKIFIGGIPRSLSSDKVKEIVTAFGQLKAFHLEVDTNGSFAFFEYVDQSVTSKACAGLNGMRLGGGIITVVQATPDANVEVERLPNYGIPDHAKALMQKPTRILKLKNVLTREELLQLSEEEIEEISEDVRLECTRFGTVKSVTIVRCNSQGDNITNIQTEKNGNSQSCLPDTSNTENQSESLKDQEINVEGTKKNGREMKDDDLGNKDTLLEENETGEQQIANKIDVMDTTNNNLMDISTEPAQEMQEDSKAAGDHDMSSTGEVSENIVTLQSVHASESGKSLEPDSKVQVGRDETDIGCLDPNNVHHQMTVVAKNDEYELSRDSECLEEASVLVEFSREEASCLAAHTLDGRLYGTRTVIASYIPNSVYQKRFPRGSLR